MPTKFGTRRTFLNEPYILAIQEAGGIPVLLTPAHSGSALRSLFELLDGLVLTGGEDVAPERYGEEVRHPNVECVPERDALEFELLEWALADDLPVLAICRGIQVLNVALGGTLFQDLTADRPGHFVHDQSLGETPRPRTEAHHGVMVRAGSCLADVLGVETVEVNSMHHQGIKGLASALTPVAHAPDGLIEGVEPLDAARWSFLLGVQWHPEELARAGDGPSRRLFERVVAAATKRAAAR
jgi:gamma-glutamyl-gamma-aminobutyrate hydrolase PuuD